MKLASKNELLFYLFKYSPKFQYKSYATDLDLRPVFKRFEKQYITLRGRKSKELLSSSLFYFSPLPGAKVTIHFSAADVKLKLCVSSEEKCKAFCSPRNFFFHKNQC